jgi:hypothetical protein
MFPIFAVYYVLPFWSLVVLAEWLAYRLIVGRWTEDVVWRVFVANFGGFVVFWLVTPCLAVLAFVCVAFSVKNRFAQDLLGVMATLTGCGLSHDWTDRGALVSCVLWFVASFSVTQACKWRYVGAYWQPPAGRLKHWRPVSAILVGLLGLAITFPRFVLAIAAAWRK